jgi:hypothetical protein
MLRMCVYMHSRFVENHPIQILEDGPLISEVVLSHLATSRKYKKVPTTSFHHIFATVTPISVIIAPKFSESLPLSSYAFINTYLLHID